MADSSLTKKEMETYEGHVLEEIKVERDMVVRSMTTAYDQNSCFWEFIDNAMDARVGDNYVNVNITIDDENSMVIISDDGTGIADIEKIFKLGATDKRNTKGKIGKFGVGAFSAVGAMALYNVRDTKKPVITTYVSAYNGMKYEKKVFIFNNKEAFPTKTIVSECDKEEHYTNLIFENVHIENHTGLIDGIEKRFEFSMISFKLNVMVNGRKLGKSGVNRTFHGDEVMKYVDSEVGKIGIMYRYAGNAGESKERSLENSGLRVCDGSNGRLLDQNTKFWENFAGRQHQQQNCGTIAAIFIPSTEESYDLFKVSASKTKMECGSWHYHKHGQLIELFKELNSIYNLNAKTRKSSDIRKTIVRDGISFVFKNEKIKEPLMQVDKHGKEYYVSLKNDLEEYADLFLELINLRKRVEKLTNKSKAKKVTHEYVGA